MFKVDNVNLFQPSINTGKVQAQPKQPQGAGANPFKGEMGEVMDIATTKAQYANVGLGGTNQPCDSVTGEPCKLNLIG